jgi:O-antigen ligase
MTTSVSNAETKAIVTRDEDQLASAGRSQEIVVPLARHSLASRFVFLVLCSSIVLSALAYGTVHYWALGLFNLGAFTILVLWAVDGWTLGTLRISKNPLQLPLLLIILLGFIQLLPLRSAPPNGITATTLANTLSLDPNATRLVLVQLISLFVYFAATLVFTDTPHRLRILVRTIMIFGFGLALFGLTQSFTSPTKVYWVRELSQSTAFGPFINRHHFAGYMELTIALPLGLLFAGSVDREKRILYLFVAGLMGVALVLTASRGGIISLVAEIMFFVIVTAIWRKQSDGRSAATSRFKSMMLRVGLGLALMIGLLGGVLMLGGEFSINRFIDSVNTNDPTTGRAHFWTVTVDMIETHPLLGTGLGAFGVLYTRFDSRNGTFRLEQAHNDYLQILSDAGIIGAAIALSFVVLLFVRALKRARSLDDFRRGLALASLGGCFAVLVHSLFDFTLHTTANALLFLILAALATMDSRVEQAPRKRRRRSSRSQETSRPVELMGQDPRILQD